MSLLALFTVVIHCLKQYKINSSFAVTRINYILKYIQIENSYFNL